MVWCCVRMIFLVRKFIFTVDCVQLVLLWDRVKFWIHLCTWREDDWNIWKIYLVSYWSDRTRVGVKLTWILWWCNFKFTVCGWRLRHFALSRFSRGRYRWEHNLFLHNSAGKILIMCCKSFVFKLVGVLIW